VLENWHCPKTGNENSDIEFQGDGSKATFYYTANDRVDFRLLIKDFAKEFSTRVEMKQVGFRQEAARLGGIGSCGREIMLLYLVD
jgi:cell fate regulator YaaT (PSP1 superfamily)